MKTEPIERMETASAEHTESARLKELRDECGAIIERADRLRAESRVLLAELQASIGRGVAR